MIVLQIKPLSSAVQHILMVSVLSLSTMVITPAFAENEVTSTRQYNIAAGALDQVLTHFAAQSGVALAFDQATIRHLNSTGLKGAYSIDNGFKTILSNQPYQVQKTATGYILVAKTNTATQTRDMGQLRQIDVNSGRQTADSQNGIQLPVITVTAEDQTPPLTRKAEIGALGNLSALETPFSITIANREQLDERQAIDLKDALIGDTSVVSGTSSYNSSNRGRFMVIRGMYTEASGNYKLNGMDAAVNLPLEAMESVQVLKGATGFMYGFAVPSGVIDYQTKKPTDETTLSTSIGYRTAGIFNSQIDAGGRLGSDDQFGYRLNAFTEQGEVYNGSEVDRNLVSAAFDYKILPSLTWTLDTIHQDYDIPKEIAKLMPNTSTALPKPLKGDSKIIFDGTYSNSELTYVGTGLAWEINSDWLAKIHYGYTELDNDYNNAWLSIQNTAGDYTVARSNSVNSSKNHLWQSTISGQFETWGVTHKLNAGISYANNFGYRGIQSIWDYPEGKSGNLYTPINTNLPAGLTDKTQYKSSEIEQKAIYFADMINFLPHWSTLIGGRYTEYDRTNFGVTGAQPPGYSTDNFSPSLALMYHPIDDINIYVSYVESLEEGGTVGDDYINKGDILDATISKGYELGLKYLGENWSITPALYRVEQASKIDQYVNNDPLQKYLVQDGVTIYEGIDIQGELRATEQLRLRAGTNFADPRLDKMSPDSQHLKGQRPSSASKRQFSFQADYNIPEIEGLSVHTDVRYYGDQFQSMPPVKLLYPSYTIWNVGGAYKTTIENHNVIIRADVKNVLDKAYWVNSGIGEPRTLALSAKIDW